jgi:hypothetical protein
MEFRLARSRRDCRLSHSLRSATVGATFVARRAGMKQARRATPTRRIKKPILESYWLGAPAQSFAAWPSLAVLKALPNDRLAIRLESVRLSLYASPPHSAESFIQKGIITVNPRSKNSLDRGAYRLESDLETDSRWALTQRIINSAHFVKSGRLQDFLVYVCRCALENRIDEISEQRIGERVFERAPDYNPTEDNIVRSQARLLRRKLEDYFASEGQQEPVILRIPKGGYSPEFAERSALAPAEPANSDAPAIPLWRTPLVRGLLTAIAALVMVIIVLAWSLGRQKESPLPSSPSSSVVRALWSQLFSANLSTTVIVPDHTFAMVQEASNQHVDLATYLRRSPRPEQESLRQLEKILPAFSIRRYTTFDGVSSAVRVSQLAEQFGGRVVIRYARDMTLRELSPGHVVLIGRPLSNLWNEMFENKLNFYFYSDLQRKLIICQNRSPQPGEQAEYLPVDEGAKRIVYASVAFLPNLNNAGNALIIAGNSSGSQEIAAEFVTNEKSFKGFTDKIRQGTERLPYFELLVRTTTLAGVAQESEVISYRILKQ